MPRYTYRCDSCKEVFEINHGMFFEQQECIKCHKSGTLEKVPIFNIKRTSDEESKKKTGSIVDEFIKDAKKELKEQRRDLETEVYDK